MLRKTQVVKALTTLFLVGCLQSMAAGYAQKVTLSEKDAKIEKVFREIRKQTGYQFLYTTRMVENAKKVTIDVKDVPLEDALARCFQEQPFTYEIKDKTIIIKSRSVPQPLPLKPEPPIDVKGRLTNDKGEPVAGASVSVKGTFTRVLTNTNGEFNLMGVEDNAILYVSHVQYEDATLRLDGSSTISATLATRVSSLDETQVIAYGTVTKRLNSGNVYTVKARDLAKQPVTNPLQALQGRVPGVVIVQETGVPGGSYSVVIRGRGSVGNGTDPLYIVDGVPFNSQILPEGVSTTGASVASNASIGLGKVPSPLNYLNVNDIESIDVLKDADATAIYGSRGANGVILITTKKGKAGKASVDISAHTGIAQVGHQMKMLNNSQYRAYRHEAFRNDLAAPGVTDVDLNGQMDSTKNINWQDKFIGGNANFTNAQVSVTGGSADVQYIINGGYQKQGSINPGSFKNENGSIHFSLTTSSPNKKFKTLMSGTYFTSYNHLPFTDMMDYVKYYPIAPEPLDVNGNINWDVNNSFDNPYQWLYRSSKARTKNLLGNVDFSYEIFPGLVAKVTGGYSDLQFNDLAKTPQTTIRPLPGNVIAGTTDFSWNTSRSWIVEPQLQYKFQISDSKFEALLGSTIQQKKNDGMSLKGNNYIDDALLETLAGASSITKTNIYSTIYKYNAGFARLKYNWQDKYIVSLNARRDGSSRFGPGKQFHNFGSGAASWLFSNEDLVREFLPLLSFGKLRASYGTTGNDQIMDYRFIDTYAALGGISYAVPYQYNNPTYLGGSAYFPNNLYNPDLAWEVNKKFEVGVEIGLAKDRFFFSASYFSNRSSNQLVSAPLPDITGFQSFSMNLPALVENKGLEFMFRTYNIKTRDFTWVSNFNITKQTNKLLAFPDLAKAPPAYQNLVVGQPLSVKRLFDLVGVDPNKGLYTFRSTQYKKDTTGPFQTGFIDKTVLLNLDPKFYGGFQNTFTYKNWELDIFLQFVKQEARNPLFINGVQPGYWDKLGFYNWPAALMDESRWKNTGDVATYQKLTRAAATSEAFRAYAAAKESRLGYVDASFIRIKNASLSYRLAEKLVKQMHMQSVRVYVQGQNLYTFTNYEGYDPETGIGALPPLRVMTGGIQVTL